jgi:hypothetical protein
MPGRSEVQSRSLAVTSLADRPQPREESLEPRVPLRIGSAAPAWVGNLCQGRERWAAQAGLVKCGTITRLFRRVGAAIGLRRPGSGDVRWPTPEMAG